MYAGELILIRCTILLAFLAAVPAIAQQPLFRVVDLDVDHATRVQLSNGKTATVKLIATSETRDRAHSAIREARATVAVNGVTATLICGNYRLPVAVAGVQLDCAVTKAYYQNSNADHWALTKAARLRLWPAGSPYMPANSFVYPLRQPWFASPTQMSNEPTYVDGVDPIGARRIYYHAGLDLGGAEGLVDVLAATSGLVVKAGSAVLDSEKDNEELQSKHNDAIWILDDRGWYHGYIHLQAFDESAKAGARVAMGQKIGTLGKEGASGGWSHLHYEILSRQPSGRWGTLDGYAFLWEAYLRQNKPQVLAVARPHQVALVGEKVVLDASRSYSASRITRFDWTFTDGATASGPKIERVYSQPGTYSEILRITDDHGNSAYDFQIVNILDARHPSHPPPSLQPAYAPATEIAPGAPVTFKVRTFGTTAGEEIWSFGDGATARTKSDGNERPRAKDGFAVTTHTYQKPGDYIVRVERANEQGYKAIGHVFVRVVGAETRLPK